MSENGVERYQHVQAHLCQGCGGTFDSFDELVGLSDGRVDEDQSYDVDNHRFWHRDCFPGIVAAADGEEESGKQSTGVSRRGEE